MVVNEERSSDSHEKYIDTDLSMMSLTMMIYDIVMNLLMPMVSALVNLVDDNLDSDKHNDLQKLQAHHKSAPPPTKILWNVENRLIDSDIGERNW